MGSLPTNSFDAAIYLCLFVAVVMGFFQPDARRIGLCNGISSGYAIGHKR